MAGLDSKVRLALASATQETTLALASINFDFSLYKVEAPKEYQTLGGVLSKRRRDAAETGPEHVFARRLGALFAQELPDTPHLIKAYGIRSSEIIQSPDVPASTARDSGVFQDWTGVDATSIWAAATSGKGALPVHLLACMLARMWSAPQAVAIWEELIRTRKRQLSNLNSDEPMHLPSLSAAAGDITREQMSRWDASARSWLAIADLVKKREQTQLMLIVKELGLSITQQEDVYASVFKAWKTALLTMENLISGISQSISDGAALLGLASWHLYPNIWAMNAISQRVGFHDNLIPHSTIVTLGKVSSSLECGVSWSLPLAYLRFYGDPIQTIGTLDEAGRRIPMQDAFYVALGAIFATWGKRGDDFHKACSFIVALADAVYKGYTFRTASSWLSYLGNSAESFLAADGLEKERYRSLISRGRGRHVGFLSGGEKINFPMFGIGTTRDVLSLLKDGDSHLAFLRLVAKSVRARPDQLLIRWRTPHKLTGHGEEDIFQFIDNDASRHRQPRSEWQYATALRRYGTNKRKVDPDADMTGHFRWMERPDGRVGQDGEIWEDLKDVTVREEHRRASSFDWEPVAGPFTELRSRAVTNRFNYVLGTLENAALFARADMTEDVSDEPTVDLLTTALQQDLFDRIKLIELLDGTRGTSYGIVPSVSRGLRALAAAADAYKLTPGATIHTSVFSQPIQNGLWIPRYPNDSLPKRTNSVVIPETRAAEQDNATANDTPNTIRQEQLAIYILDRRQTFACIAYFENVSVNLDPAHLGEVMALASNNSIFVAMPLVCDPYDEASENETKHIVGNIGRPGISLMLPPQAPMIRKLDEDVWTNVNHARFDGQLDNAFQNTSLHLSFSGYELTAIPHSISHGAQAVEASFVETLVSIFDRDQWVADLDILAALERNSLLRIV